MVDTSNTLASKKASASEAAHQVTEMFSKQSKLPVFEERIQRVQWKDVREQALLGKGAFSDVYRVEIDTPEFKNKKCAIKYLSTKITSCAEEEDFDLAAIDLAMEADLLSRLQHENIVTLHGIYGGDLNTAYVNSKGNFLIIDVLEDTLAKRLEKSRRKERHRLIHSVSSTKLIERIENVALGVARGMEYLHKNNVIFRDLKPDNVGFDIHGKPIIFDLGFARELHNVQKGEIVGSLRYMSPEMAFAQDPSLPSDVYSFGVLLYEVCTLLKPFKRFKNRADFTQNVLLGDYRPSLSSIPSKAIKDIISKSWDSEPSNRPDMTSIVKAIRIESALAGAHTDLLAPPRRGRSVSNAGKQANQALKRRNTLANCKWDTLGSSQRPPLEIEGPDEDNKFDGSDLTLQDSSSSLLLNKRNSRNSLHRKNSLNDSSSSLLNRKNSLNDSMSSLLRRKNSLNDSSSSLLNRKNSISSSWGGHTSITSFGSETTLNSTDSKAVSEFTLGRLRKPFRRPSFIGFVIPKQETRTEA